MKFIITIILVSYIFLLIQSKDTSKKIDLDKYKTNDKQAQKAANYCLKVFNFKNKTDLVVCSIVSAVNQTSRSFSRVNLIFYGDWPDGSCSILFQALYTPQRKKRRQKCKIEELDITLPSTTTTTTTTTRQPKRSRFWWFLYWLNRLG